MGGLGGGCSYILEIESQMGCPLECAVVNERICAGNGLCEYDETNGKPKCFCFDDWFGESCELDYDAPVHIELKHDDGKYCIVSGVDVCTHGVMSRFGLFIVGNLSDQTSKG